VNKTRGVVVRNFFYLLVFFSPFVLQLTAADAPSGYWPHWRGPLGTGAAPDADPPVKWSEDHNIRWKIALPGSGHSTPVVWGDRVFLTASIPYRKLEAPIPDHAPGGHDNLPVTHHQRFVVLAIDRDRGEILWRRAVHEEIPHEAGHYTGTLASASPVVDAEHLIAFFGSRGLYCLDHNGEPQWEKDLGKMQTLHGHGEGSSPALHGNTLIINWDHEGQSFVAAFDKRTGEQRWRVARDEVTSWATPLALKHNGKPQVIVSGTNRVRSYDLATGKVIWECGGLSRNVVASPVAGDGMVYTTSSYDKKAMLAIRLDGAVGDITDTDQVAWSRSRGTPYVPSPLLYADSLYFLRHYQGILSRVDAKTGKERHPSFRLEGIQNVYASPVGAAGRVYITDLQGMTLVLSLDSPPRILARNRLQDGFSASAVVVGHKLLLRGEKYLYCIQKKSTGNGNGSK